MKGNMNSKPAWFVAVAAMALVASESLAQPILRDVDCAMKVGDRVVSQTNEADKVSVYPAPATRYSKPTMPERLGRGVIAVRCGESEAWVTWRYFEEDPRDILFSVNGSDPTEKCWMKCTYDETRSNTYTVRAFTADGSSACEPSSGSFTLPANAGIGYIEIPLNGIPDTTSRTNGCLLAEWKNLPISYAPGECSVGDLDGDGEMDIVLTWYSSERKDNTGEGDTGFTWYEGLKLDGTSLWRICMGPNIRSGSHYTTSLLWDFDGDGKAELIVKTADGTVDGKGNIIGHPVLAEKYEFSAQGNEYDSRDEYGRILSGNEYLTVFSGETGEALQTVQYTPRRGDHTNPNWQGYWGDTYGNRSERYLSTVAFVDGKRPSAVMCRGYYARSTLTAWNWDGRNLTRVWAFDTTNTAANAYRTGVNTDYAGQGFHNVRAADVDFDGKDEIIYGSMVVDHDGTGLFSTKAGHGDAMHIIQMDSAHRGLQVFGCLEHAPYGMQLYEARTGEVLWRFAAGGDTGRALCMDSDPNVRGYEFWCSAWDIGIVDMYGNKYAEERVNDKLMHTYSFAVWWGDDFDRWALPDAYVRKWNPETKREDTVQYFSGASKVNGTKSTPCFSGDMYGDWREEVLLKSADDSALRLYVSTNATPYKLHTFLQDPVYRISEATEHTGYNQPTWPGFYFGPDLHGHKMWFRGQYLE